jgi:hypothetical protein
MALLVNPTDPSVSEPQSSAVLSAAHTLGRLSVFRFHDGSPTPIRQFNFN